MLARGIDVPEVDLVINFDVPIINDHGFWKADYENYMHRVGRTGRFDTVGVAVNFVETEDDERIMGEIQAHYKSQIDELKDVEQLKQIVQEARSIKEENIFA